MSGYDFDFFVIGAGSGGVRAARIAAGHGAKVAIAEEYRFGGTCVIRGCVPKKLFVYASRFRDDFEDCAGFGWTIGKTAFDWASLVAAKDKEIGRLEGIYRAGLERAGVNIFQSRASLKSRHEIQLETLGFHVRARNILIATGARPFVPDVDGAKYAITSNEAFHLEELPSSITIVGGGYIAVEFAGIFSGLGVPVTLIYRGEKILRGFDEDLREGLSEALAARGITIKTREDVAKIAPSGGRYTITLRSGGTHETGVVMYATGRHPNTLGLGLEAAGVALGKNGEIAVDGHSRSSVESIYAVGDVTDRANLTPVAIREGHAVADNLFGGRSMVINYDKVPTAVFSTPEIATVGLTEDGARALFSTVDIYKTRFRPLRHTLAGRDERMMMKLVVEGESGRILGCHVLGDDAAEIIQMAAIALEMGATKSQFDSTMALHPSAAEELVTLREKWIPPR
jgi:glutathione reductase (NADPH)